MNILVNLCRRYSYLHTSFDQIVSLICQGLGVEPLTHSTWLRVLIAVAVRKMNDFSLSVDITKYPELCHSIEFAVTNLIWKPMSHTLLSSLYNLAAEHDMFYTDSLIHNALYLTKSGTSQLRQYCITF